MNVNLNPAQSAIVQEKVKSGKYHSADEVIQEALQLLIERDHENQQRYYELKKEIERGIEELERGEGKPFDPEDLKRRVQKQIEEDKAKAEKTSA